MTKRHKNFGSSNPKKYEPLTFTLNGEDFEARPAIQGKVLIDFAKDSSGDPQAAAAIIPVFFSKVLKPDSLAKFNELLESEDNIVEVETLAEVVEWLMGEYTNRPEAPAGA